MALKNLNSLFRCKQTEPDIPPQYLKLSEATRRYERDIERRWGKAKEDAEDDGEAAIAAFVAWFVAQARERWERELLDMLGIEEFTPEQRDIFETELATHVDYIQSSLEPDLRRMLSVVDERSMVEKLAAFDHRIIAMYAGSLWAAGSLLFATFGTSWQ
jgi:hypothetical protein